MRSLPLCANAWSVKGTDAARISWLGSCTPSDSAAPVFRSLVRRRLGMATCSTVRSAAHRPGYLNERVRRPGDMNSRIVSWMPWCGYRRLPHNVNRDIGVPADLKGVGECRRPPVLLKRFQSFRFTVAPRSGPCLEKEDRPVAARCTLGAWVHPWRDFSSSSGGSSPA